MAKFRYQHIKSSVEGKAPTAAQLKVGEIGVNDFASDEKLFIKNSEGIVVDFPRGYSIAEIDESNEAIVASLNDLEERKANKSELSSITADVNDLKGQSETVASALVDLNERKANESDLEEFGEATAYALNDLECRKLDSNSIDQAIDSVSSASTGAVSTSAVYGFVTSYTPSITVDQVLDDTTSASTNPIATQAVYAVAVDVNDLKGQSETVASALVDLNTRKANVSDIPSVNGYADSVKYNSESHYVEFYHGTTAGTKVFEYDASPFLIDGMVESVVVTSITSGGSEVQVLEITWNSAAGSQVTDIPLSDIFNPDEYYTKDEVDDAERVIAESLNDLNSRKLDASAYTPTDLSNYYTKSETSGATEIQNALDGKLDSNSIDQVMDSTTSASTNAVSTSAVYDFVTAHAPSITVDNVIDNTTSASTNAVSTSAVYKCINDNELVVSTAVNNLEENKADKEEDLDGIKLKKITQSDYDALVQAGTVDPNTLYIITD